MELKNDDLINYKKLIYNFLVYRINDIEVAKDITSQTISTFLLSYDKINAENVNGWLIKTAKNFSHQYFEKQKKNSLSIEKYRNHFLDELSHNLVTENDKSLHAAMNESLNALKVDDLHFILFYYQCDQSIKLLSETLDVSYAALRKRISRIKKLLKAETFKNLGAIATKKIITPTLNDQIIKFLKRFKMNLENNSLEKMYYYFSKVNLNNYNPDYEIEKIIDYEVMLTESVYTVWVFFKNKNGKVDSFFIKFIIDEHNYLKITKPPTKPRRMVKLNINSEQGKKVHHMFLNAKKDKRQFFEDSKKLVKRVIAEIDNKSS